MSYVSDVHFYNALEAIFFVENKLISTIFIEISVIMNIMLCNSFCAEYSSMVFKGAFIWSSVPFSTKTNFDKIKPCVISCIFIHLLPRWSWTHLFTDELARVSNIMYLFAFLGRFVYVCVCVCVQRFDEQILQTHFVWFYFLYFRYRNISRLRTMLYATLHL